MLVTSKAQFYALALEGMCGNTPTMWRSVAEYWPHREQYQAVTVRRLRPGDQRMVCGIHYTKLPRYLRDIAAEPGSYIISEIPSLEGDHLRKIQGELSWMDGQWVIYYTLTGGPMRPALRDGGHHWRGSSAELFLRKYADRQEVEELIDLFERFSDETHGSHPVIEFSVCAHRCGRLDQHTLIWEIRNGY